MFAFSDRICVICCNDFGTTKDKVTVGPVGLDALVKNCDRNNGSELKDYLATSLKRVHVHKKCRNSLKSPKKWELEQKHDSPSKKFQTTLQSASIKLN